MDELPAFQRYQYAFAAHIRDPRKAQRPPGVGARRMAVYTELAYNNIESFLLACFPVLRQVLGKRRWGRLVRAFFAGHHSHTPYFRQIPDEFLRFLQEGWQGGEGYPDYLFELAHYEWIELALSVSDRDEPLPAFDPEGDLMRGVPLLNPVLANLVYRWPVHRIRPRAKITAAATYLLVFRNAGMQVRFMQQNAVSARLLQLLEPGGYRGAQALEMLAEELGDRDIDRLSAFAQGYLESLRHQGAILGTRK